jgi:hypothetical protein
MELKSDIALKELSIPIVFKTDDCAVDTAFAIPTISEQGDPSNCDATLFVHVSKVPSVSC